MLEGSVSATCFSGSALRVGPLFLGVSQLREHSAAACSWHSWPVTFVELKEVGRLAIGIFTAKLRLDRKRVTADTRTHVQRSSFAPFRFRAHLEL
jgi:hypothetical protein